MRLVISDNEGAMAVVPLARDEITIGRKEGNTIRLTERNISRQHCRIQRVNGSYLIRDLGSYNGVLVNGQRVSGEVPVQPGDEIRVGDYTLLLEAVPSPESQAPPLAATPAAEDPAAAAPTTTQSIESAVAEPPPRLVVLSPPIAGAEFSLPEAGELRIGRAPDLGITIEHRSVSREHAKITCEAGEVRIVDLGSVNGLIVNGQKVQDAKLAADDKIELGDIHLRFVAAGQAFVFEPQLDGQAASRLRTLSTVAAIVIASVLVALVIARWSGFGPEPTSVGIEAPQPGAAGSAPAPSGAARAATGSAGARESLVDACRKANQAERFAEAVANANAAMKLSQSDPDAVECERVARANHEQEQVSVRAKAALEQGDEETAWREVSSLVEAGPVARRSDVLSTIALAVQMRLRQARELASAGASEAASVAREITAFPLAPEAFRAEALALAQEIELNQSRSASATRARKSKPRAEPAEAPTRDAPAPSAAPASAAPVSTSSAAMDAASACLVRGDNPCVIRALNGRAQSPQELGLLIETYRAMGNVEQAGRNMADFVERFPTTKRAQVYRELLGRSTR